MILLPWLLGFIGWILGLEEVPQAETRYNFIAVIVEAPDKFHCTGSLISSRTVFTTCDCIGGFVADSQLKLIFRPIQTYRHFVVLGVKNFQEAVNKGRKIKIHAVDQVIQYQDCSYQRKLGYVNNLGALKLAADVHIPAAPGLVAHTKEELERHVLDRVYHEQQCIVLGYGSINSTRPPGQLQLRVMDVSLVTFLKCKGRICPITDGPCLLNIDIANNQEMCASSINETVNCYADKGSPLICQGHLTGIVKFVHCTSRTSPLQVTRINDALPYYLQLVNCSNLLGSPGMILSFFLAALCVLRTVSN